MPFFYLARCSDQTLYAGACVDLCDREEKHNKGEGAKYTRGRRPVKIVYCEEFKTLSEAMKREYQVKTWTRKEKEDLARCA